MENPYQPPALVTPDVTGRKQHSRENLRKMAFCQKGVAACLVLYVVGTFVPLLLPAELFEFLLLAVITDVLVGSVFVFLLSTQVYGTGLGMLMGCLTLVPGFGLFILVLTNGKATAVLRRNGVKVGLWGANLSQCFDDRTG